MLLITCELDAKMLAFHGLFMMVNLINQNSVGFSNLFRNGLNNDGIPNKHLRQVFIYNFHIDNVKL